MNKPAEERKDSFVSFPKIPRLKREMIITEKIDGTNAQVLVPEDVTQPLKIGSRNRWLGEGRADNHGFYAFVMANEAGFRKLPPGRYFGEWYGKGIQRGYGMETKKLVLFRPDVEIPEELKDIVHHTSVLYTGPFETSIVDLWIANLRLNGSFTVPGYMNPEGIVIFHTAANKLFKVTLEDDGVPKSLVSESGDATR